MTEKFQTIREEIINILKKDFHPSFLEVHDDSDQHIGHSGHNGKGESHFRIEIVGEAFASKSRVESHRAIYTALAHLIPPIHAVQINIRK